MIELIIDIVAKNLRIDVINRLAKLNKASFTCTRRNSDLIAAYVKRYVLTAQEYLNLTGVDESFAKSQNLVVNFLRNANLPQKTS